MIQFEFEAKVWRLRYRVPFSVISWWRTEKYNRAVGGVEDSYHLTGCAIDLKLDDPSDIGALVLEANRRGLEVIQEAGHFHIEPKGW